VPAALSVPRSRPAQPALPAWRPVMRRRLAMPPPPGTQRQPAMRQRPVMRQRPATLPLGQQPAAPVQSSAWRGPQSERPEQHRRTLQVLAVTPLQARVER